MQYDHGHHADISSTARVLAFVPLLLVLAVLGYAHAPRIDAARAFAVAGKVWAGGVGFHLVAGVRARPTEEKPPALASGYAVELFDPLDQ